MKIRHQTQPTGRSCTQTCLAMILGVPVAQVLERYPRELGSIEMIQALYECDVRFHQVMSGGLCFDGYYTATVPSLTTTGRTHQIVLRVSGLNRGRMRSLRVWDPCLGRPGAVPMCSRGTDLYTWHDLIHFQPGGRLPKRRKAA